MFCVIIQSRIWTWSLDRSVIPLDVCCNLSLHRSEWDSRCFCSSESLCVMKLMEALPRVSSSVLTVVKSRGSVRLWFPSRLCVFREMWAVWTWWRCFCRRLVLCIWTHFIIYEALNEYFKSAVLRNKDVRLKASGIVSDERFDWRFYGNFAVV